MARIAGGLKTTSEANGGLESGRQGVLDRLTRLAARLFDTPIALISILEHDRVRFRARYGMDHQSIERSAALCAHTLDLPAGAALIVEDAARDPRFRASSAVTGEPFIRFYAGAVLTGADGVNLGALCVIDTKSRPRPPADLIEQLVTLASIVVDELDLDRSTREVGEKQQLLDMAERMSRVGHWRFEVANGQVTWSDEVYRIHGVTRRDFDPNLQTALGFYHEQDQAIVARLLADTIRTGRGYESQLRILRADGQVRDVVCKAECLTDPEGGVAAVHGVFQDVTEQTLAMQRLRQEQEATVAARDKAQDLARRATLAESVAGLGHWRIDAETKSLTWSEQMYALYGLPPDTTPGLERLSDLIHPDDWAAARVRIEKQLSGQSEGEQSIIRIFRTDGEVRSCSTRSIVERDAAGRVVALVGTMMDVTEQKRAELAVAESEARYRLLADNAADIVIRADLDTVLSYVSPACLAVTGFRPDEIVGRTFFSLMVPEDAAKFQAAFIA